MSTRVAERYQWAFDRVQEIFDDDPDRSAEDVLSDLQCDAGGRPFPAFTTVVAWRRKLWEEWRERQKEGHWQETIDLNSQRAERLRVALSRPAIRDWLDDHALLGKDIFDIVQRHRWEPGDHTSWVEVVYRDDPIFGSQIQTRTVPGLLPGTMAALLFAGVEISEE